MKCNLNGEWQNRGKKEERNGRVGEGKLLDCCSVWYGWDIIGNPGKYCA